MAKNPAVPTIQPRLLNVRDAAAYLGATIWFVRTLAWEEKVKAVKFGNRLLFPREELDSFIERAKAGAA